MRAQVEHTLNLQPGSEQRRNPATASGSGARDEVDYGKWADSSRLCHLTSAGFAADADAAAAAAAAAARRRLAAPRAHLPCLPNPCLRSVFGRLRGVPKLNTY
mmetsp:Transcript_131453/g.332004  ORF Transcript_131453/g.332004 Transcript_131453/m.332004 type:complete len:103 (+) Transcript_131453:249-557(+)